MDTKKTLRLATHKNKLPIFTYILKWKEDTYITGNLKNHFTTDSLFVLIYVHFPSILILNFGTASKRIKVLSVVDSRVYWHSTLLYRCDLSISMIVNQPERTILLGKGPRCPVLSLQAKSNLPSQLLMVCNEWLCCVWTGQKGSTKCDFQIPAWVFFNCHYFFVCHIVSLPRSS